MSFKELMKLKEKLGTKIYNEAVFGRKNKRKVEFKRENKNRPREISAKKPVSRFNPVVEVKKFISRDPRFDSLCGTYNEKAFKHSYAFLNEYRANDLKTLQKELQETTDPKIIKKIKYLIQRLENQLREGKKQKEKEERKQQEKKELLESIKQGGKPAFKKKCELIKSLKFESLEFFIKYYFILFAFTAEKKILDLVSQYEELKNTGKLKKHIQRLRKKNKHKDKAKIREKEELDEIE